MILILLSVVLAVSNALPQNIEIDSLVIDNIYDDLVPQTSEGMAAKEEIGRMLSAGSSLENSADDSETSISERETLTCTKSTRTILGCDIVIFHRGSEIPSYFYGLSYITTKLADLVCPCPMPILDPYCSGSKVVQRIARHMEHLCYFYVE